MKDIIELASLLDDLDRNHAAMNRDVSVYSEAATAIRLLAANVGGGETAIRQLEEANYILEAEAEAAFAALRHFAHGWQWEMLPSGQRGWKWSSYLRDEELRGVLTLVNAELPKELES